MLCFNSQTKQKMYNLLNIIISVVRTEITLIYPVHLKSLCKMDFPTGIL